MLYSIMKPLLVQVFLFICVPFVLSVVFAAIWTYKDAKSRGLPACLCAFIIVIGSFPVAFLVYALVRPRRRKCVCSKCGVQQANETSFCIYCGAQMPQVVASPKFSGFAAASIVFFILPYLFFVVFLIMGTFSSSNRAESFGSQRFSYYHADLSGTARQVSEATSGLQWDVSFKQASEGYTCKQTFDLEETPLLLQGDIVCDGSVRVIAEQAEHAVEAVWDEGNHVLDLPSFHKGRIYLKLINMDAADLTAKMALKIE